MMCSLVRSSCKWLGWLAIFVAGIGVGCCLLSVNRSTHSFVKSDPESGFKNAVSDSKYGTETLRGIPISLITSLFEDREESGFGLNSLDVYNYIEESLAAAKIPLIEYDVSAIPVLSVRIDFTRMHRSNVVMFNIEAELYQPALTILNVPTFAKTWGSRSYVGYVSNTGAGSAELFILDIVETVTQQFIKAYDSANPPNQGR